MRPWLILSTLVATLFFRNALQPKTGIINSTPSFNDTNINHLSPKRDIDSSTLLAASPTNKTQEYTLTGAVLVHPGVRKEMISNVFRALQRGQDACRLDQVVVFYDGRIRQLGDSEKLKLLLEDLRQLVQDGDITRFVELQWNTTVAEKVLGVLKEDPDYRDGSLYGTYQYLAQECETDYCAYFNNDIFVHEGGGLTHAVDMLIQHPEVVMAVPPLASDEDFTDFSQDFRHDYVNPDGNVPYMHEVGKIRTLSPSQPEDNASPIKCKPTGGWGLTTRYYVAQPQRFVKSLPLGPAEVQFLEQHPDFYFRELAATAIKCTPKPSKGFMIHPPPWQMGKRFFEACSLEAIQKAVDAPDGLAMDRMNNMIEESWKEACRKYMH
eukprot:CAMPEP_0194034906 /NCGR_PEP_ID=MMETSP0009_2-20130614/7351_1 /TAXON_ID=210454 /ORGANISM="Grammatophora oceanica, Strain CCMP 410" /LENGTH=379 /DNA_ID=CAMNT_0038676037 /DNA_START=145 /DNA_END=1284 /DNA_ORIENTATION=-